MKNQEQQFTQNAKGVMMGEAKKCKQKLRGCERYLAPFDEVNILEMTAKCQRCVQFRHDTKIMLFGIIGGAFAGLISSLLVLFVAQWLGQ